MWHRHLLAILSSLSLVLAGCGSKDSANQPAPVEVGTIEGWIVDHEIVPVAGAMVKVAGGPVTTSRDDGYYELTNLSAGAYTISVSADGLQPAGKTTTLDRDGQTKQLNFSLIPVPVQQPYISVDKFDGYIECSAFVTAGHNHGGGGPPEGENPTDCGTYAQTRSAWDEEIFPDVDGLVVETVWNAQNELAKNLLMIVYQIHANGTHEYIGWNEGPSPLKVHVPSLNVQDRFPDGGWIHTVVEIGGDPNGEDFAAGAAIDQTFEGFTSQFFGMWPDDQYSVTT